MLDMKGENALESVAGLDEVSWRLLKELQANARLSFSELARRVGLTPPAVADRIRRLEELGIITGYRLELDRSKVGLPLTVLIRVTHRGVNCYELGEMLKEYPEVLECHRITGSESYLVKAGLRSVEHLQELIDRIMPYGETVTSVVLSSTVTHRAIEPEVVGADAGEDHERRAG